jgi:hypothetical protein
MALYGLWRQMEGLSMDWHVSVVHGPVEQRRWWGRQCAADEDGVAFATERVLRLRSRTTIADGNDWQADLNDARRT